MIPDSWSVSDCYINDYNWGYLIQAQAYVLCFVSIWVIVSEILVRRAADSCSLPAFSKRGYHKCNVVDSCALYFQKFEIPINCIEVWRWQNYVLTWIFYCVLPTKMVIFKLFIVKVLSSVWGKRRTWAGMINAEFNETPAWQEDTYVDNAAFSTVIGECVHIFITHTICFWSGSSLCDKKQFAFCAGSILHELHLVLQSIQL